jgi:microcystin-dependent protein
MARDHFIDMIIHAQGDGTLVTYDGVSIEVFYEGTSTHPNLFADVTGATPVSNPFDTPASGAVDFCAEEGYAYEIHIHDVLGRVSDKTIHWHPPRLPKVGDMRMADHGEGDSADGQWLVADGRTLSRSIYADYFDAVGTSWGNGNGSTTFNMADMRGRSPMGDGHGAGLTDRSVANHLGEETHDLALTEVPAHHHDKSHVHKSFTAEFNMGSGGSGTAYAPVRGSTANAYRAQAGDVQDGGSVARDFVEDHSGDTGDAGGGDPHNSVHPVSIMRMLVKVK